MEGISEPNAYGDLPLIDKDPARPAVTPGSSPGNPNEYDYWDQVDYVVDEANRLGLYVAFLPTWARWLGVNQRDEKVITAENAQAYGEFLGKRYGKKGIIWVLGGDRVGQGFEDVWRAMAKGIVTGISGREDYDAALMTYHPGGGHTSAEWFHTDPWLDFNMQQTGHGPAATVKQWDKIAADYARTPVKPVVEGEPLYEDHPIGFVRGVRAERLLVRQPRAPARRTGRSSPARRASRTAITPSGRCTPRAAAPSTGRSTSGKRPSTARARRKWRTFVP